MVVVVVGFAVVVTVFIFIQVNGNFDCKIIDVGTLKFSDSTNVRHSTV